MAGVEEAGHKGPHNPKGRTGREEVPIHSGTGHRKRQQSHEPQNHRTLLLASPHPDHMLRLGNGAEDTDCPLPSMREGTQGEECLLSLGEDRGLFSLVGISSFPSVKEARTNYTV